MKITDNLNEVRNNNEFVLVSPGIHPARIINIRRGLSKGNDPKEFLDITFQTLDKPIGIVHGLYFLTEASIKRIVMLYYAVGGGPAFDTDDMAQVRQALLGRTLMIDVYHREYEKNGKKYNVADIKPWTGTIRMTEQEKDLYPDKTNSDELTSFASDTSIYEELPAGNDDDLPF